MASSWLVRGCRVKWLVNASYQFGTVVQIDADGSPWVRWDDSPPYYPVSRHFAVDQLVCVSKSEAQR